MPLFRYRCLSLFLSFVIYFVTSLCWFLQFVQFLMYVFSYVFSQFVFCVRYLCVCPFSSLVSYLGRDFFSSGVLYFLSVLRSLCLFFSYGVLLPLYPSVVILEFSFLQLLLSLVIPSVRSSLLSLLLYFVCLFSSFRTSVVRSFFIDVIRSFCIYIYIYRCFFQSVVLSFFPSLCHACLLQLVRYVCLYVVCDFVRFSFFSYFGMYFITYFFRQFVISFLSYVCICLFSSFVMSFLLQLVRQFFRCLCMYQFVGSLFPCCVRQFVRSLFLSIVSYLFRQFFLFFLQVFQIQLVCSLLVTSSFLSFVSSVCLFSMSCTRSSFILQFRMSVCLSLFLLCRYFCIV